jgi:O-antigen/teichoic acid export membrane protein
VSIPIPKWLKKNSDILFNTSSLIATMLVTSGLGFAYWWVAARFYSTEAVGLASAATSAMMLLSTLFLLGQGTLLLTELPRNKGLEGSLISASILVVGISTLVASILFAFLAPVISPQLASLGSTPQSILLFAAGVSLAGVTVILDQAVIGLLQGGIQLWRNTIFSVVKLVLVVVAARYLAQTSGMSIYTTWSIGNAVSLFPIVIFVIRKKKLSPKYYIPQWKMMRHLGMSSIQHHSLNLILQAPAQLLPLLVTILLSAKMNAWFYIASMIANFVFSLSLSVTTVLHAANAAQVTTLTQKTRLTVGLSTLSSLAISAILVVGAEPILGFFGASYAENASECLRLLMLASFPLIVKNHYIAIYRIRDKVAQAIVPMVLGSLLELGLAVYGAHVGQLTGLSLGWVIALLIESLFMAPTVATVLLGRQPSNPYLDEIATSDTIMLPAFNQQTGGLQLTTLGNVMALAEIDTIMLPAVQLHRSNISKHLNAVSQRNSLPVEQEITVIGGPVKVKRALSQQFRLAPDNTPPSSAPEPSIANKKMLTDVSTVQMRTSDVEKELAKGSSSSEKAALAEFSTVHMRTPDVEKELAKDPSSLEKEALSEFSTIHMRKSDVEKELAKGPSSSEKEALASFSTVQMRRSDVEKELARQTANSTQEAPADSAIVHMRKSDIEEEITKQLSNLNKEVIANFSTMHMLKSDIEKEMAGPGSSIEDAETTLHPSLESPTVIIKSLRTDLDEPEVMREPRKWDVILDLVLYIIPLGAFLLWYHSLQGINVRQMNDLGLISVFPPALIGALAAITVGFCFVIRHPKRRYPALILYFGLLIFMLYGVNMLIEEMPRFAVVYRHEGYTEFIMRTGAVDPTLDAYFSWPGFFSLNAFITKIAGYPDILNYAVWSPVFYNAFYFGPLYMLFTSFTKNKRIVYLSIWFFYLANWIGQDYFSPQGLNFFLYLVMIAILVKWFKVSATDEPKPLGPRLRKIPLLAGIHSWLTAPDPLTTPIQPQQRRALIVCIIVIFAFVVFSHQLTPFFTILSVSALVIFRRTRLWWLPLLMIVMATAWILLMTQTYLAGHMGQAFGGFHLFSSFSQNVTSRVAGNPQHTFIARLRIYMSVLVWGCALLSAFIRWRRGYRDATVVLLALTPFPFFIIQPYGGEMLLRSYLFSLPSMVFLMAALFYSIPPLKKDSWRLVASVWLCLILLGGFFYTRYGNENMDYMTKDEVNGVNYLYSIAPRNALLLGGWDGAPWQQKDYEKYQLVTLDNPDLFEAASKEDVNAIIKYLRSHSRGSVYMLFTRSEKTTFNSMSGLPPGSLDEIEEKIAASGDFNLVYRNPDVQIYQFVGAGGTTR